MDLAQVRALANFKTEKQIQVVQEVYSILVDEEHTLSSLNRRVQEKINISEPTIRRVLEKMREMGLIVAGSKGNENIKVSFNRGYSIMAMYLAPDQEMGIQFPLTPLNLNKNGVSDKYG